jgi:hypothetical protein
MSSGEPARLGYNESDAVVVISKQIFVAKEKPRTKRYSDDTQFGEDRPHRGLKRRALQRLKINTKVAPGVLLAPLPNGIDSQLQPLCLIKMTLSFGRFPAYDGLRGTDPSLQTIPHADTRVVSCVTRIPARGS